MATVIEAECSIRFGTFRPCLGFPDDCTEEERQNGTPYVQVQICGGNCRCFINDADEYLRCEICNDDIRIGIEFTSREAFVVHRKMQWRMHW